MAIAKHWQRGESIDFTNVTSETIKSNEVVALGTHRIGVAGTDIPAGQTLPGSLHVTGVFIMPKANEAVELGQAVFYNSTLGQITLLNTDIPAGWAILAASAENTSLYVKLGG